MAALTDQERDKTIVAFVKWLDEEPLSRNDMERLIWVFDNKNLQIESLDQATLAGLQMKFRSVISQRFLPPQNPQQGK